MKYTAGPSRFGRGMFATADIRQGETIAIFAGEVVNSRRLNGLIKQGVVLPDDPLQIDDDLFIILDSNSIFFNHSCVPNDGIRNYNTLVCLADIEAGDEIFYDYSTVVGTECKTWSMRCECPGSAPMAQN